MALRRTCRCTEFHRVKNANLRYPSAVMCYRKYCHIPQLRLCTVMACSRTNFTFFTFTGLDNPASGTCEMRDVKSSGICEQQQGAFLPQVHEPEYVNSNKVPSFLRCTIQCRSRPLFWLRISFRCFRIPSETTECSN